MNEIDHCVQCDKPIAPGDDFCSDNCLNAYRDELQAIVNELS